MIEEEKPSAPNGVSPFERIRRTNAAGAECWSSRDFAQVLGYSDYRNFGQVILKARAACFNSGQRIEDHFVEITEMVSIGSGVQRPLKATLLSRYACYLIVQNADPSKGIVALGQTYFAIQTRRQELMGKATGEERLILQARMGDSVDDAALVEGIVAIYRAINKYHILCGGSGLAINDWQILVPVGTLVEQPI